MGMFKKQSMAALVLLLLIPLVLRLGGMLFNLINPEIAAGHPNYVRNYHLLNLVKMSFLFGYSADTAGAPAEAMRPRRQPQFTVVGPLTVVGLAA